MRLEITAHRIGGEDGPRTYRKTDSIEAPTGVFQHIDLTCLENGSYFLTLRLREIIPAREGFLSTLATLRTPEGMDLGERPILIHNPVCDVPLYATFERTGLEYLGTFSLGIRRIA